VDGHCRFRWPGGDGRAGLKRRGRRTRGHPLDDGGRAEACARILPLLQVLGVNIVHVGETGASQVAKACNEIVVPAT